MKAVRCHRFACVEQQQQQQSRTQRPSFRPRKPKALRLRDCLSLDEVPYPSLPKHPKETLIVIRTEYAGIQYPDALQAQGLYQVKPRLPYVPGMDVVGIVQTVVPAMGSSSSSSSTRILPGDRVMATLMSHGGTGGLSEIVVAPLKHVYKLPQMKAEAGKTLLRNRGDGLFASEEGAFFANVGRNYFAAYHSLVEVGGIDPDIDADAETIHRNRNRNRNRGCVVLVTGASGGVGMATIELAKAMGCTVVAGVGSISKKDGPESVGADAVFCYGRTKTERRAFRKEVERFCKEQQQLQGSTSSPTSSSTISSSSSSGVDLVVDVVFGDLFHDALVGCLKPLGTIALVGFAAGQRSIKPGLLLIKEARVAGSLWGSVAVEAREDDSNNNKYGRMVERIMSFLADGSISGRVDKLVPVSKFLEAFEVFEENKGRGNTVISFVDDLEDSPKSRL